MASLADSSNIHNTILNILNEKKYQVWFHKESNSYCAEKNGWDFMSDSLSGLLGLISIYEHTSPKHYKEYWWKNEGHMTEESIPLSHLPFTPVWSKN
jgi:hypothetical protein